MYCKRDLVTIIDEDWKSYSNNWVFMVRYFVCIMGDKGARRTTPM